MTGTVLVVRVEERSDVLGSELLVAGGSVSAEEDGEFTFFNSPDLCSNMDIGATRG